MLATELIWLVAVASPGVSGGAGSGGQRGGGHCLGGEERAAGTEVCTLLL